MSPLFARVIIIVGCATFLTILNHFAGGFAVDALAPANILDALVDIGCDEDVDHIVHIAENIVGSAANKYAIALLSRFQDGVALKLIELFWREGILIVVVGGEKWIAEMSR